MASKNGTILNPLFLEPCPMGAFLFVSVLPWMRNHQSRCGRTFAESCNNPIFKYNVNLPEDGMFCFPPSRAASGI
jgi:hypothetical protein